MLVSLKCVSAKSGTCTLLAPGLVLAVRGNQVAAALFDVEGCFEALSEQRSESRTGFVFLFFSPPSLLPVLKLITPFAMDTNTHMASKSIYAHS